MFDLVYQTESGGIALKEDIDAHTIWATLNQVATLFGRDKSTISRHISQIFASGELDREGTVAKIATVKQEGGREVTRTIVHYNLDLILSVGYRVDSEQATKFRIWATRVLKNHLNDGFTVNRNRVLSSKVRLFSAIDRFENLVANVDVESTYDVLSLVDEFINTWSSLDAYDKQDLPEIGITQDIVEFTVEELYADLQVLKGVLIDKKQATELFALESSKGNLAGIVGNIFQSFAGQSLYPSVEEKAANLLYFIIKNHPFVDGNKRSGAFAFVWFLSKANILGSSFRSEALTSLTLLIAESDPSKKDQMIGLILLLLSYSSAMKS